MKKIMKTLNLFQCLITIMLLLPFSMIAQQLENITTYKQESAIELAPLLQADANLFKNSILYDRVMPLANLRETNAVMETNTTHFKRA